MDFSNFRLIILAFTAVVNGLLALIVYKNNPKSATNRLFAGLSFVTILWLIDVYLSVTPAYIHHSLLWVRLSIFLAAPQIVFFYLFAHTLPLDKIQLSKTKVISLLVLTLIVMIDAISPVAFTKVDIANNQVQATPGPGLAIFVLFAIALSGGAVYALLKKLQKGSGYVKEQYRFVVSGFIIMLGLLILTVLIPVAVFKSNRFVPLVPIYTIAFLGCTTYAIVKNKLFDIRLVVARSIAYILSLGFIAAIFSLLVFGLSGVFLESHYSTVVQRLFYALVTVSLVLTYPPLKRFFDRVTNKIFFRDIYDPQTVLDELSDVLVAEINLSKILGASRLILTNTVKSSYIEFALFENNVLHLESASEKEIQPDIGQLSHLLRQQKTDIVMAEELGIQDPLREEFAKHHIAISLRLKTQHKIVGYVLFGDKKSGDIYSEQDIRLLTIVANELAIAIQNALSFEEIRRFNVTLQEKIEAATRELRKANTRLKELDKTKDEFISMASHQLRTPLTTVKGYLSMMLDGDTGKITKQQKDMMEQAFNGAQNMVDLIADMLNVSRLQSGKFVIENKPTNLADMVATEIEQLKETAQTHKLKLSFTKPANFPVLNLDGTKMRQVVMNFIDNAIYYTPAGGSVDVALKATDKEITYTVTDTGLGVPKAVQHHLFSKFYRADNARKIRPDGTGLGLFMAKKVIATQGGAIIFKSVEGKGSTFGFSFPRQAVEAKN